MREKDIHNLIEQQNPEAKQQIWEKIQSQMAEAGSQPEEGVQPTKATATKTKQWKWAAVALAIVCVVTLSIVLPIVLRNDDNGNGGGDGDGIRYCTMEQCKIEELGQTLREYSETHNKGFLYLDWYDNADEITTVYGYNKEDKNDIFYFSERIVNGETGDEVTVSVTDNKTRVDIFNRYFCNYNEYPVKDVTVKCPLNAYDKTCAMFEYQKNIYYVELKEGDALNRLLEIIQDMLK